MPSTISTVAADNSVLALENWLVDSVKPRIMVPVTTTKISTHTPRISRVSCQSTHIKYPIPTTRAVMEFMASPARCATSV